MRTTRWMAGCLLLAGSFLPVAASGEEGAGAQALLTPHTGTIFWTVLTFVIMVFILGKYAWKPLLGALESREQSIRSSIDQARADREEAESLLGQQRELLAEAHRQRSEALEQGRQDAERLKAEILEAAQQQREQLLKQSQDQVDAGMRQARAELRGVAADLVIQATEKLLTKNLDGGTQRKLVEDYLADLERSADPSPPS